MTLEINDNTTLRHIQEKFSDYYPYLQIEFFRKSHKKYEASDEESALYPGQTIGDIKKTHVSAMLEIQPWYKVADVEREFQHRFGLPVQVFKKEKEGWEQTTGMDDFTLKELNEFGRSSSDEFILADEEEEEEEGLET